MCEHHPIPCWSFVDSPCSQCASKCHNNYKCIKQYDSNCTDVINWRKTVNDVIIDITFTNLTANGSLIIVQMSISMLNSHYNVVELHIGKVTTIQNYNCLWQMSITITDMTIWVHTRSSTTAQVPRMLRPANTNRLWSVTAYARNRRRPADTGSSLHCQGDDQMPYLVCQLELAWKEHRPSKPQHCMS